MGYPTAPDTPDSTGDLVGVSVGFVGCCRVNHPTGVSVVNFLRCRALRRLFRHLSGCRAGKAEWPHESGPVPSGEATGSAAAHLSGAGA